MANHLPITSSCPLRHARVYHDFRERQRPRAEKSIASLHAPSLFAWLEHTPDCCASAGPVLVLHMGKHMDALTTSLTCMRCMLSSTQRSTAHQHTSPRHHWLNAHVTLPQRHAKEKHICVTFVIWRFFRVHEKTEMKMFAFLFSGTGALSSVRK